MKTTHGIMMGSSNETTEATMQCKYLFCHEKAELKVTVPSHQAKTPMCKKHAEEMVAWGMSKAPRLGAVQVDRVTA
jgi:hypothetical protein